jgi:hypothetical protein
MIDSIGNHKFIRVIVPMFSKREDNPPHDRLRTSLARVQQITVCAMVLDSADRRAHRMAPA